MSIKRPLAPAFLNKFDDFLLLNKPTIWAARAHLVLYYSLIFIAALSVVYFALPDDARSESTVYVWVGFLLIICIMALVGWLIYLLRFNVFKRFGIITPVTTLVDFLLYFIAASVITSFCLIPTIIETIRANNQYSSKELTDDVNNINLKICQLEYDSLPKQWRSDTLLVVDTLKIQQEATVDYSDVYDDGVMVEVDTVEISSKRYYRIIDTAALAGMITRRDSLNKVNDSTYVLYKCPDYTFLHLFGSLSSNLNLFTSEQIYYKIIKQYVVPDKPQVKAELKALIDKYYYAGNERNYFENPGYPQGRIRKFYKLTTVEDSVQHIAERKYRWENYGDEFLLAWFYCSFVLSLLVFAFRHTTVRVFFLSILAAVIIFILTLLFMAFARTGGIGNQMWLIFYFLLFTVISATTFGDRKRKAAKGIAINLFMLMLPFVPLIVTSTYYEWLQRDRYTSMVTQNLVIDFAAKKLHYQLAEIGGPLLFLVLIVVYLYPLYRKWYGLPEE